MAFKMKGSTLYGKLKLNRDGYENLADGRSKSSAFQKEEITKIPRKPVQRAQVSEKGRQIDRDNAAEARGEVYSWNPGAQTKRLTKKEDEKAAMQEVKKKYMKKRSPASKRTDKRSDAEKKIQAKLDKRTSAYFTEKDYKPTTDKEVQTYRDTAKRGSKEVNRSVAVTADKTTRQTIHKDKQKSHEEETKWLKKSLKGAKKARRKSDRIKKRKERAEKRAKKDAAYAKYREERGLPKIVKFKGL